ncbi:MAG: hypothetical protein MI864_23690 [Pseudomonadales bacterium]|uniref:PilZ domain-containing protein n=1 Tax=Oleiphilus messinensis TaxID=141451 RepID=A0A1Y0IA54_9GAMM|nr:hypothetical protein [Oleiphilus messinensis]ARU56355.1 hypothetical protein OLMES_2292 [Oleiphilus messinensis]MCG8613526.1 hypothetical protein [Pseudomonadales bacterium]
MNDAIVMEESPVNMSEIIDLKSRIKVKRGLFTRDWVDVKVYEFTPLHCVIKTDEIFDIQAPIPLSFQLLLDVNDIVIEELIGRVVKKRKDCSCFHYYIDIKSGKHATDTAILSKINKIAAIVKKKQALNSKLNSVAQKDL